jgi:hypothetical protein
MPQGLDRFASRGHGFRHEEGQHAQHVLVTQREQAGQKIGYAASAERGQRSARFSAWKPETKEFLSNGRGSLRLVQWQDRKKQNSGSGRRDDQRYECARR